MIREWFGIIGKFLIIQFVPKFVLLIKLKRILRCVHLSLHNEIHFASFETLNIMEVSLKLYHTFTAGVLRNFLQIGKYCHENIRTTKLMIYFQEYKLIKLIYNINLGETK